MANFNLYINTVTGSFVPSLTETQPLETLPFLLFFGDTPTIRIYLLEPDTPVNGRQVLKSVLVNGLTIYAYLDDGHISGTIYTQQLTWTPASDNKSVSATFALNTAALQSLIGSGTSGECYLKIGYIQGGLQTTVLVKRVTVGVGLPSASIAPVPAGQTSLSAEVAAATYWPQEPEAGAALFVKTPLGKKIALYGVDNPDGSASLAQAPIT